MPFPDDKELKRVRKLLKNVEGTRIVGEEGTKIEKFKFLLCQQMLNSFEESKMSQREFAILLGIDEAVASKVLNCKIEIFSTERLLGFYEVLFPNYKLDISGQ